MFLLELASANLQEQYTTSQRALQAVPGKTARCFGNTTSRCILQLQGNIEVLDK